MLTAAEKTPALKGRTLKSPITSALAPLWWAIFSSFLETSIPTTQKPASERGIRWRPVPQAKRTLKKGGKLILDVYNREHLSGKYGGKPAEPKTLEYPSFVLIQKRTVSPSGSQLCDEWQIKTPDGQTAVFEHTVRLYLRSNLERMLALAGFSLNEVFGGYEAQPFSANSSRLILVVSAR